MNRADLNSPLAQPESRAMPPDLAQLAEGEGFEPSIRLTTDNGFRDRRIRPLCHPSDRATEYLVAVRDGQS